LTPEVAAALREHALVKSLGHGTEIVFEEVRVGIECHRSGIVAEHPLQRFALSR
jgi:hypothetical protein